MTSHSGTVEDERLDNAAFDAGLKTYRKLTSIEHKFSDEYLVMAVVQDATKALRALAPSRPVEAGELVERLRAACVGHPHVKIEWPHRILHEAADALTSLQARVGKALARCADYAKYAAECEARVEELERERDAIESAIYGRHERGFVMRPLIDPPSIVEAVRALSTRLQEAEKALEVDDAMIDRAQEVLEKYVEDRAAIQRALVAAIKGEA